MVHTTSKLLLPWFRSASCVYHICSIAMNINKHLASSQAPPNFPSLVCRESLGMRLAKMHPCACSFNNTRYIVTVSPQVWHKHKITKQLIIKFAFDKSYISLLQRKIIHCHFREMWFIDCSSICHHSLILGHSQILSRDSTAAWEKWLMSPYMICTQ